MIAAESLEGIHLPEPVHRALEAFIQAAKAALGSDLRSVVLFGSAAEGRLRKTSDVNLILVLGALVPERIDQVREPLRTAHAAVRLSAMIVLERELAAAVSRSSSKCF